MRESRERPDGPRPSLNRVLEERPVSVLIVGECRPLVNWLAFALVNQCDPGFYWTDVRDPAEASDPYGPVGIGRVPDPRLSLVYPEQLERNDEEARLAGTAAATVVRSDAEPDAFRRLEGFLRLPSHTQEVIAATRPGPRVRFLVLANSERIAHMYPEGTVDPVVRAILATGCSLVMTFVASPPPARRFFDFVPHVRGASAREWPSSTVHCEKGIGEGLLATGSVFPLAEFPGLLRELETLPHESRRPPQ
jgi:hypothetical protein